MLVGSSRMAALDPRGPALLDDIRLRRLADRIEFAGAQQVQRPLVSLGALFLQEEQDPAPRIEALIAFEDLEHLFQAGEHLAVVIKLPALETGRLEPSLPARPATGRWPGA